MRPQSIAQLFFQSCQTYDKQNAVLIKENGSYQPKSHKLFKQRVNHFGRGLMALGMENGSHVALMSETRFEWAIADLGIISGGGVVVPIYPSVTSDQAAFILENSESIGIVVSDASQARKVQSVRHQLPNLKFIVVMDKTGIPSDCQAMEDVEVSGSRTDNETEYERRWRARGPDDLLTIIYTSGTTGNPKGVMLSHGNVLANVYSCESLMPYTPDDTCLSHLPLSHILERMGGYYCMLLKGVTIAYAEDIKTVPQNIMEVRPTILISVPRLFEKIYAKVMAGVEGGSFLKKKIFSFAMETSKEALPYLADDKPIPGFLGTKYSISDKLVFSKIREKTGGRLKYLISGGAPLAKEIADFFLGIGLKMAEGYGLTETSPVLCITRLEKLRPGTVGPPLPDVQVKIADDGEILAKGPNIMKGYYKNPAATAEVIVDGWFHTGDIGMFDSEGNLKITDRKKDLLVTSGGKNIAPQPIENALKLSPFIEQAVVLGDKRNFVSALLVPPWETVAEWAVKHGWPADPVKLSNLPEFMKVLEQEVEKHLSEFASYEKVKKFLVLPSMFTIESGELTPSMKVKRKAVNEKYKKEISSIYGNDD